MSVVMREVEFVFSCMPYYISLKAQLYFFCNEFIFKGMQEEN